MPLLQWSRRLSATEIDGRWVLFTAYGLLQWSRRLSATEMSRRRGRGPRGACFNGAVASQRRRSAGAPPRPARATSFNGAVASQRRRFPFLDRGAARLAASMEPSPLSDGDESTFS